jgi:valyl-tRNA synthetase
LAPEGATKISKSRGGGPVDPWAMIERYSADAVRYWAASTGLGKDTPISEQKIQAGARLVTKLHNAGRFAERFLEGYRPPSERPLLFPADRWILSRLQRLIARATEAFHDYDYATAKHETELFFWNDFADNYLEMVKQRLYEGSAAEQAAARITLHRVLLATLKLMAPFLPHVTEAVYRGLFAPGDEATSIHRSTWPAADAELIDPAAEAAGEAMLEVATAVRRYKSDHGLSLAAELPGLALAATDPELRQALAEAERDLKGVTRAGRIAVGELLPAGHEEIAAGHGVRVAIAVGDGAPG